MPHANLCQEPDGSATESLRVYDEELKSLHQKAEESVLEAEGSDTEAGE